MAFTDSHSEAIGGFADEVFADGLKVEFSGNLKEKINAEDLGKLTSILQSDPRPHYHNDDRLYAFEYAKYHVEFKVENGILTVTDLKDVDNV